MECHNADELMMKYMDNALTENEAALLGKHLEACPRCEADFRLYDSILTGFSEMELISTPEGFEARVMEKILALPSVFEKRGSAVDNMMCLIWGAFSVLFGFGFMLTLNGGAIMEYIYSEPMLASYAGILTLVGAEVAAFSGSMALVLNGMLTAAVGYASASRYILLAVLAVLAVAQFVVYRRAAVRTNAD